MLARTHRFHGHGSLRYVYQHGRTVRGPMSSLKFAPNHRRQEYRLAVVVSRKVHKSAVMRNRIRRRLYEAFRRHEHEIEKPYDMILTVYHEQMASIPAKDIEKIVGDHLKHAGIIDSSSSGQPGTQAAN